MRIKELGTEQPVEQKDVNLQGSFTLHNITAPQCQRRVQLTDDFADLRDDGELVISLGDMTYQEFDLKDKSCSNAVELYKPAGLNSDIVLLITCKDGKVLCVKYSNGKYSIDLIFVSEYTSSTPVIVTINGVSTAVYTVVEEEISALAVRSLEPNGYEQFMYEDTFEDACMETLSYNESHVRLSCSNTHEFYLLDGTGETDARKICPQGVGDLVNIYNEDMILVVASSSVTINTKESTNFCTLDLPTPVTKVDYARVNGKLLLLFFSYQGIYQYDTSTLCVNENLVTLVNETLLGLNGDYQNYIIFGDLLVYTVMKNELHSSRGINLSTSENLGLLANHQNHPLLYGFIFDDIVITTSTVITPTATSSSEPVIPTSTSTVTSVSNTTSSATATSSSEPVIPTSVTFVSNTTSSSTGMVTMTTSSSISTFSNTSMRSSTNTVTNNISTLTSVTMTTTPSTTDPKGQSKSLKDVIPYVVVGISIVVFILFFISLIVCYYCRRKYQHCCRKQLPLVIPQQEESFPLEQIQRTSIISSNESNTPPVETTSLGSNDDDTTTSLGSIDNYDTPIQVQPSVPVGPSPLQNTDRRLHSSSCLSINGIPFGTQEEVDTYMYSIHNNKTN